MKDKSFVLAALFSYTVVSLYVVDMLTYNTGQQRCNIAKNIRPNIYEQLIRYN
jgi:hypothetical protein